MNTKTVDAHKVSKGAVVNFATTISTSLSGGAITQIRVYCPNTGQYIDLGQMFKENLQLMIDVNISPFDLIFFIDNELNRHPNPGEVLTMFQRYILEKLEPCIEGNIPYDKTFMRQTISAMCDKLCLGDITEIIDELEKTGFEKT